jgi:ferredoxin
MVYINKNKCVGCAICVDICPEGIKLNEDKAEIINEDADCLKDAADACPQKAIVLDVEAYKNKKDKNTNQNYNQYMPIGRRRGIGAGRGPRDSRGGDEVEAAEEDGDN